MAIFFYETAGEGAHARLERFAAALTAQAGSLGCRLLASADRAELYLLVCEWRGDAPVPVIPEDSGGVAVWHFELLESYGREGVQTGVQQNETRGESAYQDEGIYQKDDKLNR